MAELGLLHCWSTFPAVPRENARKTDKALVKLISKITKINYPDGILSSFEEIGRLPGPPPFRLDPGAVISATGRGLCFITATCSRQVLLVVKVMWIVPII